MKKIMNEQDLGNLIVNKLQSDNKFWEECRKFVSKKFLKEYNSIISIFELSSYLSCYANDFEKKFLVVILNSKQYKSVNLSENMIDDFYEFSYYVGNKYLCEFQNNDMLKKILPYAMCYLLLLDLIIFYKDSFETKHPHIKIDSESEDEIMNQVVYSTVSKQLYDKKNFDDSYTSETICYLYYHKHQGEDLFPFANNVINSLNKRINKISKIFNSYSYYKIQDLDYMTGFHFEQFLGIIFSLMGYQYSVTQATQDQGLDLIVSKNGIKYGVQAKRYSSKVGNKSVQEVIAGSVFYHCDKSIVVTNSYFTISAVDLASRANVQLWDREYLSSLLEKLRIPKGKAKIDELNYYLEQVRKAKKL